MPAPTLTAKDIFVQALELHSPEERKAFLDRVCFDAPEIRRKVEELLQAYVDAGSLFLKPPELPLDFTGQYIPAPDTPVNSLVDSKTADHTPAKKIQTHREPFEEQIGPYTLIKQLGEGGMGTVYLARQEEPIRRDVALKIIRADMSSEHVIARFNAERQALTMMDHANIARVYDAGTTEAGQPYFVMELIAGQPLTRYCNEKSLSIRERLMLFITICQAVQHAHQKGIVHRDLKPSNVLVALKDGKPVAKVIDFGLAKAIEQPLVGSEQLTQPGYAVGTLDYMSPEQANASSQGIDTRTDIYSLGVMLYELLTGTIPLDRATVKGGVIEIVKKIVEEVPPKPSERFDGLGERRAKIAGQRHTEPARLVKQLRGDLDWITLKALEKNREQRYESASGFANDVERYLHDEPVEACPPSRRYRLKKFVRRNQIWVTASCVGISFLVLGIVGLVVGLVRANEAEALERTAKNQAEEERDRARDAEIDTRSALNIAHANIRLQVRSGVRYGEQEKAILRNMLDDYRQWSKLDPDSSKIKQSTAAKAAFLIASLTSLIGTNDEAEACYREAIQIYQHLMEKFNDEALYRIELARCHFDSAYTFLANGKLAEEEGALLKAIQFFTDVINKHPSEPAYQRELADASNDLGVLYRQTKRIPEAEAALRDAVAWGETVLAVSPANRQYQIGLAASYGNLANIVRDRGDPKKSLEWYLKTTAILKPINSGTPKELQDANKFLRNACWDRANARGQLGLHADAIRDWENALSLNAGAKPDEDFLFQFLEAAKMELRLQTEAKPSPALLYEAAVLNAQAAIAAKAADEDSLERQYCRRSLDLLMKAKSAGWFRDSQALKLVREEKRFQALPADEFKQFVKSLEMDQKPMAPPGKK